MSTTTSSTATAAAPTFTGTSPQGWSFDTIEDGFTCEPLEITWTVDTTKLTDDDRAMALVVLADPSSITPGVGMLPLASRVLILDQEFNWTTANVPPGSYIVQAHESKFDRLIDSLPFDIQPGPDMNCLLGSSNTTVPSISLSTGSIPASSISGIGASNTLSPVVGGVSSHKSSTGAIAGGVIGALAALAFAALGAWYYFVSRRRAAVRSRRLGQDRAWGGIDSVDHKPSNAALADFGATAGAVTPRSNTSRSLLPALSARTSIGSLREKRHSHSPPPDPFANPPSSHEMNRLESTPRRSLDTYTPSTLAPTPDPFVHPSEMVSPSRRVSRTVRKPVPAYEPTPEELEALALARSVSARSGGLKQDSSSTSLSSGSRQPSVLASTVGPDTQGDAVLHGLKSKGSGHFGEFDERAVHYLIPDPPRPPPA